MAKRKLLHLEEVDLISFVDKGDNPLAMVTLAKRAVGKDEDSAQTYAQSGIMEAVNRDAWRMADRIGNSLRSIMADDEVEDKAALIAQSLGEFTQAVKDAVPVWLAGGTVTKKEGDKMAEEKTIDIALDGLSEDVQEAFKALTGRIESLETELADAKAAAEAGAGGGEGGEGDKVAKVDVAPVTADAVIAALREALDGDGEGEEVDPKVAKAVTDAVSAEIQKAEETVKAEREKREELEKRLADIEHQGRRERFIKMAGEYDVLPNVTGDDFGVILDKAEAALETDEFERLQKVLSGAAEAISQGELLKSAGKEGDAPTAAVAELEKRAKAQVEATPSLTLEQAKDKVLREDQDLNARILAEEETRW